VDKIPYLSFIASWFVVYDARQSCLVSGYPELDSQAHLLFNRWQNRRVVPRGPS